MVEDVPEEYGYWELVDRDSPFCEVEVPEETEEPSLLPAVAILWQMIIGALAGMLIRGGE